METDLAELQLDLRTLLDGPLDGELLALALGEDEEVVEVDVLLALEVEAAPRLRLELDQPLRARPDEERRDLRRDLNAVRLSARAGRERAQPSLDVECRRSLGDDDPVAAAGRTLLRHHLAWPVCDVLPRHLDETEW